MAQMITQDTLIEDVINNYPHAIKIFMRHCLHCIGCPISHHHSVRDCARENNLDMEALLAELNNNVSK